MGDLSNKDKGEWTIVDPDNDDYELHIDQYGAAYSILRDAAGAVLIGQKVSASSIPVVISSDQSSIPVSTTPVTPDGTTLVNESDTSSVTKLGGTDSFSWTIPSGETVEITAFSFGGYLPTNTSNAVNAKCELYHRPNGAGNTTGQTLVYTLYLNSQSFIREVFAVGEVEYTGDGTAVLELDVTNWSQQDAELFKSIRGYY